MILKALIFGGSSDPCGLATFMCIGKLGIEENKVVRNRASLRGTLLSSYWKCNFAMTPRVRVLSGRLVGRSVTIS